MKIFTQHLDDADETYFQHMRFALSFAGHMLIGAIACTIHAIAPFLFVSTGSQRIKFLHERMVVARRELKHTAPNGTALNLPGNTIESAAARGGAD